ncbi:MAG TPA: response regulator [Rhizomicrobium sp.]|nr:response regulator [Rhizomicrobium sp.]
MTEKRTNVLVVDDSLTVRMDLTEALEASQLRVVACTTVAEAKTALARDCFGLIILDVLLPDGDGVDLLEQIREMPALEGVAIILLSDEAQVRDRIRGLVTGADEYIGKPYDSRYVVACAQDLLRRGEANTDSPRETILVIDDSITFCEQMKEALEGASYRVLAANSGEAGLRLAANARPSAIIVDRMLPGIDGVSVLRRIRLDGALRYTPCILLTASEEAGEEVSALDAGADAFVRKNEDLAIILARLNVVLRNAKRGHGAGRIETSLQGPKRILVVDGDEAFRRRVTDDLRAEGYEVAQAHTGEEAFDLLSAQAVDCILLDLDLPGIGSIETCRRIKSVSFASGLPVIIAAGRDDRDAIIACLDAGADDYVGKSGDVAVLRARVLAQIRRKQFEDESRLIREQIAVRETAAAEAQIARDANAEQSAAIERCHAQIAQLESAVTHARAARWSAMDFILARVRDEIVPALGEVEKCLHHMRRTVADTEASQSAHLSQLVDRACGDAAQAMAILERYKAALAMRAAQTAPDDLNDLAREFRALAAAGNADR